MFIYIEHGMLILCIFSIYQSIARYLKHIKSIITSWKHRFFALTQRKKNKYILQYHIVKKYCKICRISLTTTIYVVKIIKTISSPRGRGGRPSKKTEAPRSDRGYICYNSGGVLRQSFSVACNCSSLLKFRIRPHFSIMKKLCRRPHVEIRLRKKVTALSTSRFSRFLSVLTN